MTSALTGSDYPTLNEGDYSQTIKETTIKIRHPDEELFWNIYLRNNHDKYGSNVQCTPMLKVKQDQSLVYNKPLEKRNLYFVTKLEIRRWTIWYK